MKSLKYIIIAIVIIFILFSCNQQSNSKLQQITLQGESKITTEQLANAREIISKRLKAMEIKNFEVTPDDQGSQLVVKLSDSLKLENLTNVLTERGDVNLYATLSHQEALTELKKLDQKENSGKYNISDILSLLKADSVPALSPAIGFVYTKDTSKVSSHLKVVQGYLSSNIKLVWAKASNKQDKCTLYAIETQGSVSGKLIKNAYASTVSPTNTEINIIFNDEGTAKWKEMTLQNLGKSIAIVIDDKVYAAPVVKSEVANGRCIITGNYTKTEANQLAAILKNDCLPVSFKLSSK